MSKIENGADGTVCLSQEYPLRENPQLTDTIMVGDIESGTVSSTTAGQIKSLYTGNIAEDNSGFVTGDEVSAALALKADSETVSTALNTKVDKVEGMGLSHEDYTAPEKDDVATLSMFYKPVNDALDAVNGETVRGGVPGKLAKLTESKENIRQAIIRKGINVTEQEPMTDYAGKIRNIRTEDGEWIPNPAWPDIEKMVDDMEGDYDQIHAYVLDDGQEILPLHIRCDNLYGNHAPLGDLIRLSDGTTYTREDIKKACPAHNMGEFWHTWDKTKDVAASDGKTYRWILVGTKNTDNSVFVLPSNNTSQYNTDYLYAVIKSDVEIPLPGVLDLCISKTCECVKFTGNVIIDPTHPIFYHYASASSGNGSTAQTNMWYYMPLKYLIWRNNSSGDNKVLNTGKKGIIQSKISYSHSSLRLPRHIIREGGGIVPTIAKEITMKGNANNGQYYVLNSGEDVEKIVLDAAYEITDIYTGGSFTNGMLPGLVYFQSDSLNPVLNKYITFTASVFPRLRTVRLPENVLTSFQVNANGLNLSKESLINIMKALKADPNEQHTLYLGMNKDRLTDEEKAIATDKNWGLS